MKIVEYVTLDGKSPFAAWFHALNAKTAARITVTIARMEQGNIAASKSVGSGVKEARLHFGPGYRLYYGVDGDELIILLTGGTKRRQERDIAVAQGYWRDYKTRKKEG